MKKIVITSLLFIGLTFGCQAKQAAPNPDSSSTISEAKISEAKKPAPEKSPEEILAEKARLERDKAQAKKLAEEGQLLPPRVTVKLNVIDYNDKIALSDVDHSYEFVKAGIRGCYMRVLAFDLKAEGNLTLALEGAENHTSKCTVQDSSIHAEDFESCVQKACVHWPIPQGATLKVKMEFSSTPAPTVEEIREINHKLEHDGHEGHDHE